MDNWKEERHASLFTLFKLQFEQSIDEPRRFLSSLALKDSIAFLFLCSAVFNSSTYWSISFRNEISIVRFTYYIGVFGQDIYRSLSPDLTAVRRFLLNLLVKLSVSKTWLGTATWRMKSLFSPKSHIDMTWVKYVYVRRIDRAVLKSTLALCFVNAGQHVLKSFVWWIFVSLGSNIRYPCGEPSKRVLTGPFFCC